MTSELRGNWFWVANGVIDRCAPTAGVIGLAVYCCLARYVDSGSRRCYPSLTLLTRQLRTSRRRVVLAIKRLENAGLVEVTRARGKTNHYRLLPVPEAPSTVIASRSGAELVSQRNGTRSTPLRPAVPQWNTNKTQRTRLKEQDSIYTRSPSSSTIKRLIKHLEEKTGYPVTNWGKETRILTSLLKRESEADILDCLNWLTTDPWWSQRKLSYATVSDQISFFKAKVKGNRGHIKWRQNETDQRRDAGGSQAPRDATYVSGHLGRFVES